MYEAYRDIMDSKLERIVLTSPSGMIQITPGAGMNIYSWIMNGRELLMPTQDVGIGGSGYGNPILFPTPNRIRDCKYEFEGKTYTFSKDGKPRFIHGLALDEPFVCHEWTDDKGAYCEGYMDIKPGDNKYDGYPFECRFTVKLSFCDKGILMNFKVENKSSKNMPFGVAIHPYFTRAGDGSGVTISCPATHRYEADDQLLPTGKLIPATGDAKYDVSAQRKLSLTDVDTVYSGMDSSKKSRIEFTHWNAAVELHADDAFGKVVVYTPPNRPGFCIEPQTCSTDFINLYSRGLKEESGIIILPSGDTWSGRVSMDYMQLNK